MKNYYTILGVSEDASVEVIKDAYKKLARKFHPDKNPDDPFFAHWFKEINEAQQVLLNLVDRAEYDLKLTNYADAYELMKPELMNKQNTGFQQVKQARQNRFDLRKVWHPLLLLVAAATGYLAFAFSDGNAETASAEQGIVAKFSIDTPAAVTDTTNNILAELTDKRIPANAHINKVEVSPISNDVIRPKEANQQQLRAVTEVAETSKVVDNTIVQQTTTRPLTSGEIDKIMRELRSSNKSCVQLIQSTLSNINNDFAIASVLRSNGFVITGRKFSTVVSYGLEVIATDNCAVLTIGIN